MNLTGKNPEKYANSKLWYMILFISCTNFSWIDFFFLGYDKNEEEDELEEEYLDRPR